MANGLVVRIIPPLQADFEGSAASPEERELFGLPPGGTASGRRLEALWIARSKASQFSDPEGHSPVALPGGLPHRTPGPEPDDLGATNFAGGILPFQAPNDVQWVSGVFTMPNGYQSSTQPAPSAALVWIGLDSILDGTTARVVFEISTEATPDFTVKTWWGLGGFDDRNDLNFSVAPGDAISVIVQAVRDPVSKLVTGATIGIFNLSSGFSLMFTATGGNENIYGDRASWMVEKTAAYSLARYGSVVFTECEAGLVSGAVQSLSSGVQLVDMINANKQTLSYATQDGGTVQVRYGPQLTIPWDPNRVWPGL